MITDKFPPRPPRFWVALDLESVVLDDAGHRRYQAMERYVPNHPSGARRDYEPSDDPRVTPRWVFQQIVTASVMVLAEADQGGIDIVRFETFSAPERDERAVVDGVFKVLAETPPDTELVSWAGGFHDVPLIVLAACRHGLTLPPRWRWMAFNAGDPRRHFDFARQVTGGLRMKPIHMAEVAAALDLPAKMTAKPSAIASLAKAGSWVEVQEACEGDVITLALLLARWRTLVDERADIGVVGDRILRRIEELRPHRGYVAELSARRQARFTDQVARAANDAAVFAPWLHNEAA